jgi:mRNA interferase MazF
MQGERYAVVVQSDDLLPRSTVIVAPTSTVARPAGARPRITVDGVETRVLVEQIVAVDADRLGPVVGRLDAESRWAVDDALAFVLGLD